MYGASVTSPMEVPRPMPSYFAQIPSELPEMKDASVGTIRLAGTLDKRLPSMPSGDLDDLSFTNSKQIETQKYMNDMRYVYDISRRQEAISRSRARKRNQQSQKQAERR